MYLLPYPSPGVGVSVLTSSTTHQPDGNLARQQLLLAEQRGNLKRLEIGQVPQCVEAEVQQEGLSRDVGVRRAKFAGCAARRR